MAELMKIPMNYARFIAIVKCYEYYTNNNIEESKNNNEILYTGFDDYLSFSINNCLRIFLLLEIFYQNAKIHKIKTDFDKILLNNGYCNFLEEDNSFQQCLKMYEVEIKNNFDIDIIYTNFSQNINFSGHEFDQLQQFQYLLEKLSQDENILDILNIETNLFEIDKNIFSQICNNFGNDIFIQVIDKNFILKKSKECYSELVHNINDNFEKVENLIGKYAQNWEIKRVNLLERIIIAFGYIENKILKNQIQVVINEYVNFAKIFINEKSGHFVNGVLDKILKMNK